MRSSPGGGRSPQIFWWRVMTRPWGGQAAKPPDFYKGICSTSGGAARGGGGKRMDFWWRVMTRGGVSPKKLMTSFMDDPRLIGETEPLTRYCIWRWLFQEPTVGKKICFFRPPETNIVFQTMIFGIKGLEMNTYKPPKRMRSYHTHGVNNCWLLLKKRPKNTSK